MASEREKELKKLNKDQLIELITSNEDFERKFQSTVEKMQELIEAKIESHLSVLEKRLDFRQRVVEVERQMFLQQQYGRRECVEIVGIPDDVPQKELENKIIDVFSVAGVKVYSRDFHAVHRLGNGKTVIAKLINRKDAQSILRNKRKLRLLDAEGRKKLIIPEGVKVYINESLCGPFRFLMGKCNALFKNKHIAGFYTNNGCIKINLLASNDGTDGATVPISHIEDLYKLFGADFIDSFKKK